MRPQHYGRRPSNGGARRLPLLEGCCHWRNRQGSAYCGQRLFRERCIDYAKLFACAFEGQYPVPYGKGLLLAAFEKQIGRGVNSVPRMYLDGTETETWQDPKALLSAICAAYEKKNPGVSLPKGCTTSVHATDRPWLYSTKRCTVF